MGNDPHAPKDPDFCKLLAEPIIRQIMKADNVDEAELLALLERASKQIRSWHNASNTSGPSRANAKGTPDERSLPL
ncbi:hypothetical protein BA190_08465 [Labrys sp. WJW]|uniref:hypothetical protein n=1 Tax=Labrys sp. WJW TaxID=1737983 RepID=UPI00082D4D58|nr:hypothetical protein [Labrys sp. WJW]OCC05444.1 hypothetical protein BA190_08465 [Labrys sp. WJW]